MSDMVLVQDNTSVDMDLEEGELSHDDDQDLNNNGHMTDMTDMTDESKFPGLILDVVLITVLIRICFNRKYTNPLWDQRPRSQEE